MPRRVSLSRVALAYADGSVLHTASSGVVAGLDELRLVIEQDGALAGVGAARVNIEYLTHIPAEALVAAAVSVARSLDWTMAWPACDAALDAAHPGLPAPVRMLFDMAAADAAAREAGRSLVEHLGGVAASRVNSNQTLFRTDDATLLRRARAYAARGFIDQKLRIGFAGFADDLRRLALLRAELGGGLLLSADANGSWSAAEAPGCLAALAPLGLRYVEQPVAPGDWEAMAAIAAASPIPVMLDESLADVAAVERLAATRAAPMAHLKLAKLGGLDRLLAAGRRLQTAGIAVMVGQMNEGVPSTLAAAHAALVLRTEFCELYGADGLAGDPAGGLLYDGGYLHLPPGPGLGLARHEAAGRLLWENTA
ncbi:MAG: mandelate racemase/muconate lactonizing enzyme family protein [Acidisphaera sp.]|nr:mandelate racemase/muconate lactonizing enzyme family protein [Acidisphaera sp.]